MQHTNPEITDPRVRTAVAVEIARARRIHHRVTESNPLANPASRLIDRSYFRGVLNGIRYAAEEISIYLNRYPQ